MADRDYFYKKISAKEKHYRLYYKKKVFESKTFADAFEKSIYKFAEEFFKDLHICVESSFPDLFYKKVYLKDLDIFMNPDDYPNDYLLLSKQELNKIDGGSCSSIFEIGDLPVFIKAFEFRYCANDDKKRAFENYLILRNAVYGHKKLDPYVAHERIKELYCSNNYIYALAGFKKNSQIYRMIVRCLNGIDETILQEIFAFYDEWSKYLDNLLKEYFSEPTIDSETSEVLDAHSLFCYKVIIPDETVAIGKEYKFIKKAQLYARELLPTASAVDALKNIAANSKDDNYKVEAERAKTVLSIFNDYEGVDKQIKIGDGMNSREEVRSMLDSYVKENIVAEKLCFLTESELLAKLIWREIESNDCLKNIIVLKPKGSGTAVIFKPEEKQSGTLHIEFSESSTDDSKTESISKNTSETVDVDEETNIKPQEEAIISEVIDKPAVKSENTYNFAIPQFRDTVVLKFGKNKIPEKISVRLIEEIGSGGEGVIYRNDKSRHLIKIFKTKEKACTEAEKISVLVNNFNFAEQYDKICWPCATVWDYTENAIIGYAMEEAYDCVPLNEIILNIIENEESEYVKDRIQLVDICIKIAKRFEELHSIGHNTLMGDINLNNILVQRNTLDVFLVDVDSYQFNNYLCKVGRPDFTSKRMHNILKGGKKGYADIERKLEDENFAISVLFFYILMLGEFPYSMSEKPVAESIIKGYFSYYNDYKTKARRNYMWQNLSPEIKESFKNSFVNHKYVDDSTWIKMLYTMKGLIENKKLSDEIEPMCALQADDDVFTTMECLDCGKTFETTKKTIDSDSVIMSEQRCKKCIKTRANLRAAVAKVRCTNCGEIFTVNAYDCRDIEESKKSFWKKYFCDYDETNIECPDCLDNLKYSRNGENENPEKLKATLVNAMLNLLS